MQTTVQVTQQAARLSTTQDIKSKLSMLWIFYMFNQAYGDIGTLYYSVFINATPKVQYTQTLLLGAAVLVEIPMVMILLSRTLKYRANRWTNIIAGIGLSAVNAVTLFVGTPTLAYLFITIISIAAGAVIVGYAWKWRAVPDAKAMTIPQ
jgi:hypothetical protein